jgi:hypothetical protein
MNGDDGWMTRLFIHNYFPLLGDTVCPAEWSVTFYNRRGDCVARRTGEFSGASETAVIEVGDIPNVDVFGIAYVHIRPRLSSEIFRAQYGTTFFSEYYVPGTNKSVIAHSLNGSPKAIHSPYYLISTSWKTPENFVPYLFIAGGCNFQKFHHPPCAKAKITFTNEKGEKKIVSLTPFGPRECKKIDLFSLDPAIKSHVGSGAYMIEIDGQNIMPRLFLFETDGNQVFAEHL